MKIIHTADWHLGRRLGRIDRTDDFRRALEQLAAICQRESADVLLVCGDLFENARADVLRFWIEEMNRIFVPFMQAGGTILAITGNHDNENVAQMLREAMRLAMPASTSMGGQIAAGRFHLFAGPTFFKLPDRGGQVVQFIAMPWPTLNRYLTDEEAQSYQGVDERNRALKAAFTARIDGILSHPAFDKSAATVLAAHILTAGSEIGPEHLNLGEGQAVVLRDGDLPTHLAYVALGDVHKAQTLLGLDHVRYSGSIDRIDGGESSDEKGVVLVDIDGGGLAVTPRWIALNATPLYAVDIADPSTEMPTLAERYPDHETALVKLSVRYRAGRDGVNEILSQLDDIFPRWYSREAVEENAAGTAPGLPNAGDHTLQPVRQTVITYLQTQLESDADREQILQLANELLTAHEQLLP